MSTLEDSQYRYNRSNTLITDLKVKIAIKERQIERLRNRINKIQDNNWWGDVLIRPVMEDIKTKFPELTWDTERLVPLGLRCAVSVFGHDKDGNTVAGITFTPGSGGVLHYDTGKRKPYYPSNSIGGMNGMDNIEAPLTDMELLYDHVRRNVEESKQYI